MKRAFLTAWAGVLVLIAGVTPAAGQTYVQGGNALDANQRVGSAGLNAGARRYIPNAGNNYVTGNSAGGTAFRGYSPVRDPNSLYFSNYGYSASGGRTSISPALTYSAGTSLRGLPSDSLWTFNRDSANVATIQSGRTLPGQPRPYYSPGSTVANTGAIIGGLNRPGTSQLMNPYGPVRQDLRVTPTNPLEGANSSTPGGLLQVDTRLMRIDNGRALTGNVNERLLRNPLFGAVREVPVSELSEQARGNSGAALAVKPIDNRIRQSGDLRSTVPDRETAGLTRPGRGTEADESTGQSDTAGGGLRSQPGAGVLSNAGGTGTLRQQSGVLSRALPAAGGQPRAADANAARTARPTPFDRDLDLPVHSLVGEGNSPLNRYLAEGEGFLKQGQYYRAASAYEMACLMAPSNPEPYLGRSMALLAAGDYMTSANNLFQAIRLPDAREPRESLADFKIDLKAFVPDLNVLDRRRADLERRLEVLQDDYRLRFLLGYAEYSSGLESEGLKNLERAVELMGRASAGNLDPVRRFVGRLRERASTPGTQPAR